MRYKVWVFGWSSRRIREEGFRRTRLDDILGFREGYARRCDYDYRPRLGLNMGGGMGDEQRKYNMNIKEIGQVPDRRKK